MPGRTVYMPEDLYQEIKSYMEKDKTFVSVSEFVRNAIREYFKSKGE